MPADLSFDKKIFDSCVHYIGSMDEGQTQRKIFDYLDIAKELRVRKLNEDAFDYVFFDRDEKVYPLAQGSANFVEQLYPYFDKEYHTLKKYIRLLNYTGDSFPLFNLRKGSASEKEKVSSWALRDVMLKIKDETLRNVLMGNNLLYAGDEHLTPFYIHALVTKSYIDSAYKFVGGSSQLAMALWRKLRMYGGVIFRKEKVCALKEKNGLLTHAITESGNVYEGRHFIANIHPKLVLELIDSNIIKSIYRNRVISAKNSISAFMVNIVLNPGKVPYLNANIYWNKSKNTYNAVNHSVTGWPVNYALYYTEDAQHPGFAESVSILCYMHADMFEPWKNTYNNTLDESNRCIEYQNFKTNKANELIDVVAERFPLIKRELYSFKVATPLTFRDYTGSPEGSMYGIMANVHQPERTSIPVRTKIPNLLLTGQNIGIHGVLGVSMNAIAASGELLGLDYLIEKINKKS